MPDRRRFLRHAAAATAGAFTLPAAALSRGTRTHDAAPMPTTPAGSPAEVARDEDYWERIAARYEVTREVTNLEGGYYGLMATPVREAFHRHTDRVNRENSYFARREFFRLAQEVRERAAAALGLMPGEIAFTRNATEALQALIGQYNRLRPGDTVMYADLDYPSMQQSMDALAARHGATVVTLTIPEPASHAAIMAVYEEALRRNERTRLLLLTHANNKTGLIHPVRDVTALARSRGVDVVVDAAHSWGHVPFDPTGLGADYIGINLHKWIGAPIGVGAMIVREAGLAGIDRAHGDPGPLDRIDSRIHTGTTNFATLLTVPDALDFQEAIGFENKFARVRYLRDLWVSRVRGLDGIDVLTPDDPDLVGAITSFRLHGQGGTDANRAVVQRLLDEFGIFTVARNGIAGGDCVRVTPALYNLPPDLDRLVEALRALAG